MEGKYFTCEIHEQNFLTVDALKQHVFQDHPNDSRLKCPVRNEIFESEQELQRHRTKKLPVLKGMKKRNPSQDVPETPSKFIPIPCRQELSLEGSIISIKTEVIVEAEASFQCHICSTFFAGESTLSQHLLSHLEDRPLFNSNDSDDETSVVKIEGNAEEMILNAALENLNPKLYANGHQIGNSASQRPRKTIEKQHLLIEHLDKDDSNDEDYIPEYEFEDNSDYEIENDSRSGTVDNFSQSNKKDKSSSSSTKKPKINRTGQFQCYFCKKNSTGDWEQEHHLRCHTMERPFQCPVTGCKQSYRYEFGVRQHLIYHSQNRRFKCNVCRKSFHVQKTLTEHMLTHSDERHHHCKQCKSSFKRLRDLNRHLQTRHSGRRFKCKFCGADYNRKDVYNQHMKRHKLQGPILKLSDDRPRPYECKECQKAYINSNGLKLHTESVHSNMRPFECKVCSKTYRRKDCYNQHMKIKHL